MHSSTSTQPKKYSLVSTDPQWWNCTLTRLLLFLYLTCPRLLLFILQFKSNTAWCNQSVQFHFQFSSNLLPNLLTPTLACPFLYTISTIFILYPILFPNRSFSHNCIQLSYNSQISIENNLKLILSTTTDIYLLSFIFFFNFN